MNDASVDYELVVPVAAWELDEWAWLCAHLEEWLANSDHDTRCDYRDFTWPRGPKLPDVVWQLASMANRMRDLASGTVTDPLA
ncbi:MAG: hypothetical protein ACRDYV_00335 [Acidimicrobiia bacterium]